MNSILIIEDDPAILLGLEEIFKLNNYEVLTSMNGKEGLSLALSSNPDLIVLDINLPYMSGFDVFKFVKMLSASNPTTIEWLTTDIVYYGMQNKVFREFAVKNFNPIALYHHYKSMCKSNYLKYLKSGNLITYKKYLYAYRGLINAKWVVHKKSVPPIIFTDALKGIKKILSKEILEKLNEIIKLKSKGREKDIIIRGGQNIYPREIEDYLSAHPKILEVAVVPMPDTLMGEKACAFVTVKKGNTLTLEEMVDYLKSKKIAMFKVPERLEVVDEMPLVASTKIDRKALKALIEEKLKAEQPDG